MIASSLFLLLACLVLSVSAFSSPWDGEVYIDLLEVTFHPDCTESPSKCEYLRIENAARMFFPVSGRYRVWGSVDPHERNLLLVEAAEELSPQRQQQLRQATITRELAIIILTVNGIPAGPCNISSMEYW